MTSCTRSHLCNKGGCMFNTKFPGSIKTPTAATPEPASELRSTALTSPLQKKGRKQKNEATAQQVTRR